MTWDKGNASWMMVMATVVLSTSGFSCSPPCGGPCDDTVHPFPIRSATYVSSYGEDPECRKHAGPLDAGTPADGGVWPSVPCNLLVEVDAASGVVTQTFTYRGQEHVIRYRRTRVEEISKTRWFDEEEPLREH